MMMVLVCSLTLACPAFAGEARASELIKTYSTNAAPSAGSIAATFSVTSNSSVSKLGCSSITLYEKSGTSYKVVIKVFAENSSGRDTRTETRYVTGK